MFVGELEEMREEMGAVVWIRFKLGYVGESNAVYVLLTLRAVETPHKLRDRLEEVLLLVDSAFPTRADLSLHLPLGA